MFNSHWNMKKGYYERIQIEINLNASMEKIRNYLKCQRAELNLSVYDPWHLQSNKRCMALFFFNLGQRALGMYLVGYDNIRPFTHPHIPGCGQWMLQMLFFLGTPWTCQHFYDSCSFWFVWVFFLLLFISTTQKLYKQNHQTQNQNRTTAQHCLPKLGAAKQRLHHS